MCLKIVLIWRIQLKDFPSNCNFTATDVMFNTFASYLAALVRGANVFLSPAMFFLFSKLKIPAFFSVNPRNPILILVWLKMIAQDGHFPVKVGWGECKGNFVVVHVEGVTCNLPQPETLWKKRPWQRCFLVDFTKFLRTTFYVERIRFLLLNFVKKDWYQPFTGDCLCLKLVLIWINLFFWYSMDWFLYNNGLCHERVNFIFSYLSNRTQGVKIKTSYSDKSNIKYGVPLGSILEPLLSNID